MKTMKIAIPRKLSHPQYMAKILLTVTYQTPNHTNKYNNCLDFNKGFPALQRSRYGKGHFRPCPGYCCFCYILLKYVMFEQNLVFQADMSSFLHFGAKSTKNNEKSPISGKN